MYALQGPAGPTTDRRRLLPNFKTYSYATANEFKMAVLKGVPGAERKLKWRSNAKEMDIQRRTGLGTLGYLPLEIRQKIWALCIGSNVSHHTLCMNNGIHEQRTLFFTGRQHREYVDYLICDYDNVPEHTYTGFYAAPHITLGEISSTIKVSDIVFRWSMETSYSSRLPEAGVLTPSFVVRTNATL